MAIKLTVDEFIIKSKIIHSERFDYSELKFKNKNQTKM